MDCTSSPVSSARASMILVFSFIQFAGMQFWKQDSFSSCPTSLHQLMAGRVTALVVPRPHLRVTTSELRLSELLKVSKRSAKSAPGIRIVIGSVFNVLAKLVCVLQTFCIAVYTYNIITCNTSAIPMGKKSPKVVHLEHLFHRTIR